MPESNFKPSQNFSGSQNFNPYWNRLAVDDPKAFFGRQQERERLIELISRGQPVSIVGQRRIGKTSLLRSLGFPDLREWTEKMRIMTLDGSYFEASDEQGFLGFLLDQMAEELNISPLPVQRESLFEAAKAAQKQGVQLVILMDEFDLIAYNPKIAESALFPFLRALVQQFRISIVLVSRDGRLEPLLHDSGVGSPFWNIFTGFSLGSLLPEDADLLIRQPAMLCNKPFSDDQIQEISMLGGLHPFFLNIACTHAFNGDWGEELKAQFFREAFPHFDYLVNQLNKHDLKALRDCASGSQKLDARVQADLVRRGLLVARPNEPPVVFSSVFAELLRSGEGLPANKEKSTRESMTFWGRSFQRR
jgi:hypothetical protein